MGRKRGPSLDTRNLFTRSSSRRRGPSVAQGWGRRAPWPPALRGLGRAAGGTERGPCVRKDERGEGSTERPVFERGAPLPPSSRVKRSGDAGPRACPGLDPGGLGEGLRFANREVRSGLLGSGMPSRAPRDDDEGGSPWLAPRDDARGGGARWGIGMISPTRHPARREAEMRDPGDWAGCFGSRTARCVPVSWVLRFALTGASG